MALFVNTNTSSLNAQRQMINSGNALDTAFKRLSSGFRINSAADDAAGLQISNRLTSQINGLDQAARNANDGISLAQVVEGGMEEITNSLQRMRTLAVQSQNGINATADRQALQKEVSALKVEISRIAATTRFGDQLLLNGGSGKAFNFLVGAKGTTDEYIEVNLERSAGWGAAGLGIDTVGVLTSANSGSAILAIDAAIAAVDAKRADMGAVQNRIRERFGCSCTDP
jgi:flagellin